MFPEQIIEILDSENEIDVRVRHELPEGARMMESLADSVELGMILAITVLGTMYLLSSSAIVSNAAFLAAISLVVIAAFWFARVISQYLLRQRFFLLRRFAERHFKVALARREVVIAGKRYGRGPVLRFSCAPHRRGKDEEREERVKERLIPMTYRLAWQVWLQHGEEFILLADVSDEASAKAITRALQTADERAARGMLAASEDAPFGTRQLID